MSDTPTHSTGETLTPRPQTMDEWFLSLEKGRQAMLREDKWMLAQAAFIAGAVAGQSEQLSAANRREAAALSELKFAREYIEGAKSSAMNGWDASGDLDQALIHIDNALNPNESERKTS